MTIVFDEIVAVVNAPGFERRFWDAGRWYEALTTLREAYVAAGADTTAVDAAMSACDGASAESAVTRPSRSSRAMSRWKP